MNRAKLTKILALSELEGMTYQEFDSIIKQTLNRADCSAAVAFLDINQLYGVPDLQSEQAKMSLYEKINY
jgi:hypothetical protein